MWQHSSDGVLYTISVGTRAALSGFVALHLLDDRRQIEANPNPDAATFAISGSERKLSCRDTGI